MIGDIDDTIECCVVTSVCVSRFGNRTGFVQQPHVCMCQCIGSTVTKLEKSFWGGGCRFRALRGQISALERNTLSQRLISQTVLLYCCSFVWERAFDMRHA